MEYRVTYYIGDNLKDSIIVCCSSIDIGEGCYQFFDYDEFNHEVLVASFPIKGTIVQLKKII